MYADINDIVLEYVGSDSEFHITDLSVLEPENYAPIIREACLLSASVGRLHDVEVTYDFCWKLESHYLEPVDQIFGDHEGKEVNSVNGVSLLYLAGVCANAAEHDRIVAINNKARKHLAQYRKDLVRQGIPHKLEEVYREVSRTFLPRLKQLGG